MRIEYYIQIIRLELRLPCFLCVSRTLFRMSLVMAVRRMLCSVTGCGLRGSIRVVFASS